MEFLVPLYQQDILLINAEKQHYVLEIVIGARDGHK